MTKLSPSAKLEFFEPSQAMRDLERYRSAKLARWAEESFDLFNLVTEGDRYKTSNAVLFMLMREMLAIYSSGGGEFELLIEAIKYSWMEMTKSEEER